MASFGVPALSFMTRYVKGYDIKNGRGLDLDGKAWERNIEGRYVVQSGAAKNLTFRVRQASYRGEDRGGKIDENRFITEYPINNLLTPASHLSSPVEGRYAEMIRLRRIASS